jgi:SAM-dependent methyltransferase
LRESTRRHWQDFWQQAGQLDLDDVYGTDGRLVREITRVQDPQQACVLEVGAGTGRDAVALGKAGARIVTVDYVRGSLALTVRAAQAAGTSVHPVAGDGLLLPFGEGTFDVVYHQGLLEHFPEPAPLLCENVRVLRPGGYLVVDVPQRFHYYTLGKKILIRCGKWFAGWETEFTPGQLERLIQAQGLILVHTYGDWMVPGLPYRALRKILLTRFGLRLPMYPKPWPLLGRLAAALRRRCGQMRLALYTTPTIGVVARKPSDAADAEVAR